MPSGACRSTSGLLANMRLNTLKRSNAPRQPYYMYRLCVRSAARDRPATATSQQINGVGQLSVSGLCGGSSFVEVGGPLIFFGGASTANSSSFTFIHSTYIYECRLALMHFARSFSPLDSGVKIAVSYFITSSLIPLSPCPSRPDISRRSRTRAA